MNLSIGATPAFLIPRIIDHLSLIPQTTSHKSSEFI